ncbi:unnamed protein product [Paramecium octaurelia]|uniref:Uncharacterized protein n=1 Tax=Paramecium octaurelia TaxID=43137 RepID=A0A8S1VD40_PAROT|nr:unnamed protein product [Paramecium octaurelia]
MNNQETYTHSTTKYKPIPGNERIQIVKALVNSKMSPSQVSDLTGYNLSTIKAIYRVYKQEGRMWKKEKRDQLVKVIQNFAICLIDEATNTIQLMAVKSTKSDQIKNNNDLEILEDKTHENSIKFFKENESKLSLIIKDQNQKEELKKQFQTLNITEFQDISKSALKPKHSLKWKKIKKYFQKRQLDYQYIESCGLNQLEYENMNTSEKVTVLRNILESQMNLMIQNLSKF